jgi:hypothetical protein
MLADPVQDSGAGPMKLATWRAGGMVNSVTDEPFARFSVELDLKQRKLRRDEGIGGFMTSGFELSSRGAKECSDGFSGCR